MIMRVGRINRRAVSALAGLAEVDRKVKVGAEVIRAEARRLAPMLTGTLRRSITVVAVFTSSGVEYHVGWDRNIADYGWIVEAGSEDTAPQPHLRPAANKYKR